MAPYRNKAARLHLALFCAPANRVGASWVVLSSSGARKCFHQPAIRLACGEDASSASLGQSIRLQAAGPIDRGTMPARASH